MTEEKRDVIEIKKDALKQFFILLGASFVGCFLAILLAGQLLKPKAPPCPCFMTHPPCCMKMMDKEFHKHHAFKPEHKKKFERRMLVKNEFLDQKKLPEQPSPREIKK